MNELIEEKETVSADNAAAELGTTLPRILMLIRKGVLKGSREGGEWYVTRESFDLFQSHGGDLQVPTGCRASCGKGACGSHGQG